MIGFYSGIVSAQQRHRKFDYVLLSEQEDHRKISYFREKKKLHTKSLFLKRIFIKYWIF